MIIISQTVAGNKLADAVAQIEGYEVPLLGIEDNLEINLHIFSFDNFKFENDIAMKVDL